MAQQLWIEGTDLHFIDATGAHWYVTGTPGVTTSGPAGIFINGAGVLSYTDATGTVRTVPFVSTAGTGDNGALWIDDFVHWAVGGQLYTLHADVAYGDATQNNYGDHSDYSDMSSSTPTYYDLSYADFTDAPNYSDASGYTDHSDAYFDGGYGDVTNNYYTDYGPGNSNTNYNDFHGDNVNGSLYSDHLDAYTDNATYTDFSTHSDTGTYLYYSDTGYHYDYTTTTNYTDTPHTDTPHADLPLPG